MSEANDEPGLADALLNSADELEATAERFAQMIRARGGEHAAALRRRAYERLAGAALSD